MNSIRLQTRGVLLSIATICFLIYNIKTSFMLKESYLGKDEKIRYVNKCSCELLSKLTQPLLDFEKFPCLEGLTPAPALQENGRCVRTVNLPKHVLSDRTGCVLLRYGRGTPICTHSVDEDIHVSRALNTRGMWEEELVRPMLSTLDSKPDMVLLDIGCNIGVYSLAAALYLNRVFCVDANYENLYLVSKSLTQGNLWGNVSLIWNAISEERGTVILRKEDQNVGGARIDTKSKTAKGRDISVNSIKLDDLTGLFKKDEIYMKLDVEGFEHHVLNSGKEFFKMVDVRYVQMEFDTHRGHLTGTEIIDIMSGYGFLPYVDCDGIKMLDPKYHSEWPYDACFIKKRF